MMERTATLSVMAASPARTRTLKALLACGLVSSLLYVGSDVIAAMSYPGYSYANQAFSELLAIGSPVRAFMIPLMNLYNLLVLAFGVGVVMLAGPKRSLRAAGFLLIAFGVFSAAGPYVPMHARGTQTSITDVLHIVDTIGMILSMMLFIVFGGIALGRAFRIYSAATILAIVGGAILAFGQANAMASGAVTPWMGIVERLNIYSMLLWVAVFSIVLLRGRSPEPSSAGSRPSR